MNKVALLWKCKKHHVVLPRQVPVHPCRSMKKTQCENVLLLKIDEQDFTVRIRRAKVKTRENTR